LDLVVRQTQGLTTAMRRRSMESGIGRIQFTIAFVTLPNRPKFATTFTGEKVKLFLTGRLFQNAQALWPGMTIREVFERD
jgi:hypothetical protein